MIEETLIKLLSEESEKIVNEEYDKKLLFDNEICAWKDIKNDISPEQYPSKPAGFRIRSLEKRPTLTRSTSSNLYSGTISSSNESLNVSSPIENKPSKSKKTRKRLGSFNHDTTSEDRPEIIETVLPVNIIRIYKPALPRRQRKPIKVFRLPRVEQGEEE